MIKSFRWIAVALVAGILVSIIFPNFSGSHKLDTLYTVAGIMFSVGMSLIASSPCSRIRFSTMRLRIQSQLHELRDAFLWSFGFLTLGYLFKGMVFSPWDRIILRISVIDNVWSIFCIFGYGYLFLRLQKLNALIDERIHEDAGHNLDD